MVCSAGLQKYLVLPTDPPAIQLRKKVLLPLNLMLVFLSVMTTSHLTYDAAFIIGWIIGATCLAIQVYLFARRSATDKEMEVMVWLYMIFMILSDWRNASAMVERCWPAAIIVIDLALIFGLPDVTSQLLVLCVTLWLALTTLEDTVRFGLYDLISTEENYEERRERNTCNHPPCVLRADYTIFYFFLAFIVFYFDFRITRKFASDARREKTNMLASIKVAESVASALAKFDVEGAEVHLSASRDSLPSGLFLAFAEIVDNLKTFRPFLPSALIDPTADRSSLPPPLQPQGTAALVFTNVQSFTSIWEACPEDMKSGLRVHNLAIRECIRAHMGYEIKTAGDSFMVAFESPDAACAFGLRAQEQLYSTSWPEVLLAHPACAEVKGTWRGPRVQIGVHYGEVELELNDATARFDYLGPTVNRAAKLAENAIPGVVTVSREAVNQLSDPDTLRRAFVVHGPLDASGAVGQMYLVNKSLIGRKEAVLKLLAQQEMAKEMARRTSGSSPPNRNRGSVAAMKPWHGVSSATTATVDISLRLGEEGEAPPMLEDRVPRIITCASRTSGRVVTLMGTSLLVAWNVSSSCSTHTQSSLQFLRLLHNSVSRHHGGVTVGVSSSRLIAGDVGNAKYRFMAVVAPCVTISRILSGCAETLHTFALYAPFRVDNTAADIEALRPVDNIPIPCGDVETLTVYELRCGRPCSGPDMAKEDWCWSPEYQDAFNSRNFSVLDEVLASRKDPTLSIVVSMLRNQQHLFSVPPPASPRSTAG